MYIFTFVHFQLRGVLSSSGHQCHVDRHGSKTRHLVRKTREQHALITEHWWSNLKYSFIAQTLTIDCLGPKILFVGPVVIFLVLTWSPPTSSPKCVFCTASGAYFLGQKVT